MPAPSSPCVLVVADPERVAELAEALAEPLPQGAIELLVSSGGDDTIELFEARRPRVVVLTASLEVGDAKSLIEVLRERVPRDEMTIVLVGDDERGPIRTALDAIDMKPDRFVGRPLSIKALRFAIASGFDAVARALGELPADAASAVASLAAGSSVGSLAAGSPVGSLAAGPPVGSLAAGPPPSITRSPTPTRGSGPAALLSTTDPPPFGRAGTAPRFSAPVEAGDVPTVVPRGASRLSPSINGDTKAPSVARAATERGTGVPPLDDETRSPASPVPPLDDETQSPASPPNLQRVPPLDDETQSPASPPNLQRVPPLDDETQSPASPPNLQRAPTDRGTGIAMTPPASASDAAASLDPHATRAVLRARWEALADSIGDERDEADEGDAGNGSSAGDRGHAGHPADAGDAGQAGDPAIGEAESTPPPIPPIEIALREQGSMNPDFVPGPPGAPWRPGPSSAQPEEDVIPPPREPTLILHDDVPPRAPLPETVLAVSSQRTDPAPSERWSQPVLLAELIDRSRDSSRELIAHVTGADDAGLDELADDLLAGHVAHAPMAHVLRGGPLQRTDELDADGRHASDDGHDAGALHLESEPPSRPSEDRIGGRDFARQLRAKMSMMAQRLFQSDSPASQPSVDVGPHHDHHTEIDLAALGEEPALGAGVTEIGRPTPPDPVQVTTSPGTWDTQVRERGLPDSGEIVRGVSDAAMILARMFALGFTGRVGFRKDGVEKVVYFDQGRPVFASSNEPGDRMGELLVREGKITAAQYERCQVVVAQSGRRMGEILVDFGYLKRRELLPAVRRHVEDILYSLFGWDRGHYHVTPDPTPSAERIRLSRHPASLVLEGIRRKLDRTTLEKLLGPPSTVIEVADRERLGGILNTSDLASEERSALTAFDGQADLAQVARSTGVDLADVLPLAWGLCVLGLATARRAESEAEESTALVGETDLAIDRERVRARWQLVTEADYFALLGVRRDATAFEIRRAYQAARRDFAPETFPSDLRRELARELEEIATVLDEAFRVLRDDRLRQAYLANLLD